MSIIDKIQQKIDRDLYIGSREAVFEEMWDDIESLLILFKAKNKAIEDRIKQLEQNYFDTTTKDGIYNFNINNAIISELKNLL